MRESAENYLEAILIISLRGGAVRSVDLAEHFGYSKPSISRAVSLLTEHGYITRTDDGAIELTETGSEVAHRVYGRHEALTAWLVSIGVGPEVAAQDACRIEHVISEESFARIRAQVEGR